MEHEIPVTIMEQEKPETKPSSPLELPDQIREISDMVSSAFNEFRESKAYDKLLEGRDSVREYIRRTPLPSLGYALGAGVLLGFILKRNR
ncbi:MAG: hypothetical protein HGB02_04470 [Chlorobiaceae bacterium]|nr:hypothetical protein [Chlorobiaceae bacterium]